MDLKIISATLLILIKSVLEHALPESFSWHRELVILISVSAAGLLATIASGLSLPSSLTLNSQPSRPHWVAWTLGLVALVVLLQASVEPITGALGIAIGTTSPPREISILKAIDIAVVYPLVEELIFRWLLLCTLLKIANRTIAVAVSAVAFGILHQGAHAVIVHTLFGAGLAWSVIHTGRLTAACLAHCSANLIGVSLALAGLTTLR